MTPLSGIVVLDSTHTLSGLDIASASSAIDLELNPVIVQADGSGLTIADALIRTLLLQPGGSQGRHHIAQIQAGDRAPNRGKSLA